MKNVYRSSIPVSSIITNLIELRDRDTFGHVNRTKEYMQVFLDNLPLEVASKYPALVTSKEIIINAAQIHDIGKVAVHNCVLSKGGSLAEIEYEMIKLHVQEGVEEISKFLIDEDISSPFLETALRIVGFHHCHWAVPANSKNRSYGFPEILSGENIPIEARIMTIIDAYDVMRSKRPYKLEEDHETACGKIRKNCGTQFDPTLVRVFFEIQEKFEIISEKYKTDRLPQNTS